MSALVFSQEQWTSPPLCQRRLKDYLFCSLTPVSQVLSLPSGVGAWLMQVCGDSKWVRQLSQVALWASGMQHLVLLPLQAGVAPQPNLRCRQGPTSFTTSSSFLRLSRILRNLAKWVRLCCCFHPICGRAPFLLKVKLPRARCACPVLKAKASLALKVLGKCAWVVIERTSKRSQKLTF